MTATVGNIVGMTQGEKKYKAGKKMMAEAEQLMDEFEWQDLNASQISTVGADLRREEANRMSASAMEALRSGGSRAVLGGVGMVQANNNMVNAEIAANLDEQQKALDARNVQMIEQRQAGELSGYGKMYDVGMSLKYGGIADYVNAAQAQSAHVMEVFSVFKGGQAATGATKSDYGTDTTPDSDTAGRGATQNEAQSAPPVQYQQGLPQPQGGYYGYNYNPQLYGGWATNGNGTMS